MLINYVVLRLRNIQSKRNLSFKVEFSPSDVDIGNHGSADSLVPRLYEKAASILSSHDPPVILAKVDASHESNEELASEYEITRIPTLKILRNGGKSLQEFKGPREADAEIKSLEDATSVIDEDKISIVGIFTEFSGEKFDNFTALAEKLRSDFDFGHTLDPKLLPRGESSVNEPTVRLLKPFDERSVDFQDFHVDALEKFVEEASVPTVTLFNKDPTNHPFVIKFFNSPNAKAMLFLNFSSELVDGFKSKFYDLAVRYKGNGISFLIGDIEASQGPFQPDHIGPWLKEYMDGHLQPFVNSEPIPETNNEPVKVIVADSLHDLVINSGKNVLLEFYAPWCGDCEKLTSILDEVAVSFENDADVIIAKLDATANDIPTHIFEVHGYPTLYFKSASGKFVKYDGNGSKEDIIDFIRNNRENTIQPETVKDEP
ncbi:hypothetical protein I3843_03G111200 [Carya illinoinensis]|nr:hypothetical protein I3843_03G111200 [Carya illinoinensis]